MNLRNEGEPGERENLKLEKSLSESLLGEGRVREAAKSPKLHYEQSENPSTSEKLDGIT